MHNIPWRVTNISSDHPTIVSTVYSSRTYIYKLLRDGITALTLQIRNEFENKYQTMRYTVRSGMPSTMEVSVST